MASTRTRQSLRRWIGQPFITGVLSLLPLALTLAILAWVVVFLHDLVGANSPFGRILSSVGLNVVACEVIAYAIGLTGTLAFVYAFGMLVERGMAHRYESVVESALNRLPVVNTVYSASKHLTSLIDGKNNEVKTMTPVLCNFGGVGSGTVALGLMPVPRPVQINGHDYHVVIIPTAPFPFGGALLCVPTNCVQPAGCSIDGLMNVFMSMGASAPDYIGTPQASDGVPVDGDGDV